MECTSISPVSKLFRTSSAASPYVGRSASTISFSACSITEFPRQNAISGWNWTPMIRPFFVPHPTTSFDISSRTSGTICCAPPCPSRSKCTCPVRVKLAAKRVLLINSSCEYWFIGMPDFNPRRIFSNTSRSWVIQENASRKTPGTYRMSSITQAEGPNWASQRMVAITLSLSGFPIPMRFATSC